MDSGHETWVLLVGAAVVLAAALQALAHRTRVPTVVGYLLLGLGLGAIEGRWQPLGEVGLQAFGLLADLGVVVLLFRVGLDSDLVALARKLRPAALVWIGNVALAGALGYAAARLGGLDEVASALCAVALTATSIAVSAAVWEEAGALDSPDGQLMLDVAELDDISGIALMALLFAVAPLLAGSAGAPAALAPALLDAGAWFALKFVVFAAACWLVMRYVERPLTHAILRLERPPQRMLSVVGVGFLVAALAGALGFSLAVGAFFAGLVFSRDPEAVHTEGRLGDVHALLVPFFFIGIGLQVDLGALGDGLALGAWLLAAAVVGKLLGAGLSALLATNRRGAALIGASMIPRAEIAMVVAFQGRAAGLLPQSAYAALVLVAAATCLLGPWLVRALMGRELAAQRSRAAGRGRRERADR